MRKIGRVARRMLWALQVGDRNVPQIAAAMDHDPGGVSSSMPGLIKRGLIELLPHKSAANAYRICAVYRLTDAGRAALAEITEDLATAALRPPPAPRAPSKSGSGQIAGPSYRRGLRWGDEKMF